MNEHEMLQKRFGNRVFQGKQKEMRVAIELAYADMSRRQNGHSPAMKEACIVWLLEDVFTGKPQITNFDAWHEEQSNKLIEIWNTKKARFGTVGKAQKVLNMAFKYISCITPDYDHVLPQCHMTLDSYTLAWYKDVVRPWAKMKHREDVASLVEWSKINSYKDYMLIQNNIREYLKKGATYSIAINGTNTSPIALSSVPVEAEFVIWEGQIIKEKYANLIKEMKNYTQKHRGTPAGKEYDAWLLGELFADFVRDYCQKF